MTKFRKGSKPFRHGLPRYPLPDFLSVVELSESTLPGSRDAPALLFAYPVKSPTRYLARVCVHSLLGGHSWPETTQVSTSVGPSIWPSIDHLFALLYTFVDFLQYCMLPPHSTMLCWSIANAVVDTQYGEVIRPLLPSGVAGVVSIALPKEKTQLRGSSHRQNVYTHSSRATSSTTS